MLLQCKDVGKAFGVRTVLSDVSFIIEEKEKAAIVGVNGAGKTTLFNIITNLLQPDSGQVIFSKEASMGCLKQLDGLNLDNTIYGEMLTVFEHLISMEKLLRQMEADMSALSGERLDALMNQYSEVSHEFESKKGFEYKSRIRGVIKGLGFSEEEFHQPLSILSGGQKTRVALGKLLLSEPDMLLLDEPTNHLDIESILWLEDFLKNYTGSVVIISHDRYFLDKIVTKIVEIENGKTTVYNGNYTSFVHEKSLLRDIQMKSYQDQQREIKRQEEVIKKLKSFNREKSIKRAESREKLLAKMPRTEKPDNLPDTMRFILNPKRESGNDVLDVTDLSKAFDGQILFSGISFQIKKGEKTALIGPNGIGKTTLIRIILKSLEKDSGDVREGANVIIGYYDQEHHNIDENKTIFQEISDSYPKLTVQEIRDSLAAFVFTGDDIFKQIKSLSGGERGRVALTKIMLSKANFLILDEPTNHLDIYSKEILESTLRKYSGTVLFISHDRYFINSVADKIIELMPDQAKIYLGNYDYFLEKRAALAVSKPFEDETAEISSSKEERLRKKESQAEERRIKAQLKKTEKEIEKTEESLRELDEYSSRPEVYTNPVKAREAVEKREELDAKLTRLYEQWEELHET